MIHKIQVAISLMISTATLRKKSTMVKIAVFVVIPVICMRCEMHGVVSGVGSSL